MSRKLNIKESIARAIEGHHVTRDNIDINLISNQAEHIQTFLEEQKIKYEQLKRIQCIQHKLRTDSDGNVVFDEGTLIHCANKCDAKKLVGIKEQGILSGDFVGIPEFNNDESYFCADFYRADKQIQYSEFIERIQASDKIVGRGPFGKGLKNNTKIAFVFDSNDELNELTTTDMYRPENNEHIMQLALKLLESYKGEKNGQSSAIPYGIPSSFITGIIIGDGLLQNSEYINLLNQLFPNCYILNREGKLFFSPELTLEQNKENKLVCLKSIPEQEEWKRERTTNIVNSFLNSAVQATEQATRTEEINNQASNIKTLHNQKGLPENEHNVTK